MPVPAVPASKLNSDDRRMIAERFVATAQWSRLSTRGSAALDAFDGEARITIRVFAKGCPRGCLREVLQALAAQSPVTDPVIDGSVEPGSWHHKAAWWGRDGQTSRAGDATLTLIREFSDGPSSRTDTVEDGCGSTTSIRYEFDVAEIETLPSPTPQGHVVRISGVSRDPETQLFSYYVTDTESKTKTLGELLEADDRFYNTYGQDWTGLRGSVGALTDENGDAVTVPVPSAAAGTTIEVGYQRDPSDCTLSAKVRKRVADRDVTAATVKSKTVFDITEQTDVSAASAPLAAPPEPAGGVTYRHANKFRADGLTDTEVTRGEEREVKDADVAESVTAFQEQTRSAHKSLTDAEAAALPEPSAAAGLIVSVQKAKTAGARTDATVTETQEKEVENADVAESDTVFQSQTRRAHKSLTPEKVEALPAAAAAAGKVVSVQKSVTAGARTDATVTETQEKTVAGARTSKTGTVFESEVSTLDRGQEAAPEPSAADGVITSVSSEKSEGGLLEVQTGVKTEKRYINARVSEAETAFEETKQATHLNLPAAEADALPGSRAENGLLRQVSKDVTPGGRVTATVKKSQEISVPAASTTLVRSARGTRQTVVSKSVGEPELLPGGALGRATKSLTPGKLWDHEVTTALPAADGTVIGEMRGGNYTQDVFEYSDVVSSKTYPANGTGLLASGILRTVSFSEQQDDLSYVRTIREVTPKTNFSFRIFHYAFVRAVLADGERVVDSEKSVWLFLNCTMAYIQATVGPPAIRGVDIDIDFGVRPNEFGLWEGSVTRVVRRVE